MYWIAALFVYLYLCYAIIDTLAPKIRESFAYAPDEATVIVVLSFVGALLCSTLWPLTVLVAIPAHIYLRRTRSK